MLFHKAAQCPTLSPTLSFILAVRDESPPLFHATIQGLLRTTFHHQFEIIVVDDASLIPQTAEHPGITLIRNSEPLGSARSRRTGAEFATGEILIFLDPHMTFAPDWLDHMLQHADSGSLFCAAWWDYELTKPVCWGADFLWCPTRDHRAGLSPGLSFRHRTAYPGHGAAEIPMLIGACYLIYRTTYNCIGGFSPHFRTWGKLEQDLCSRARILGFGVACVTDAHVGHFSRPKFPYPVHWEDIEFNQLVTIRTAFEPATAQILEAQLQPLPPKVETWLAQTDFKKTHHHVQSRRQMTDAEFFRRYVTAPPLLT